MIRGPIGGRGWRFQQHRMIPRNLRSTHNAKFSPKKFRSNVQKDRNIYVYEVFFVPQVTSTYLKSQLIEKYIALSPSRYYFDGQNMIFSVCKVKSWAIKTPSFHNKRIHSVIRYISKLPLSMAYKLLNRMKTNSANRHGLIQPKVKYGATQGKFKNLQNFRILDPCKKHGTISSSDRTSILHPTGDNTFHNFKVTRIFESTDEMINKNSHEEQTAIKDDDQQFFLFGEPTDEQSACFDESTEIPKDSPCAIDDDEVHFEMPDWASGSDICSMESRAHVPSEKNTLINSDEEQIEYDPLSELFDWETLRECFWEPIEPKRWAIIATERDKRIIDRYCETLGAVADTRMIKLSPPDIIYLDNDRTSTYVQACRNLPPDCELANVIVPNDFQNRYDGIKKVFWCEKPIASHIITKDILEIRAASFQMICIKIWLQMSVKLGAEVLTLHVPTKNMMVAGYDCYYDKTQKSSIGALVCSMNERQSKWYSRASYDKSLIQMSIDLSMNLKEGLREYMSLNGCFPDQLLIYRAGFFVNHIFDINDFEMDEIQAVLDTLIGPEKIRWALVLVFERESSHNDGTRSLDNPPLDGKAMVETLITRRGEYDFYIFDPHFDHNTPGSPLRKISEDTSEWRSIHYQQLVYKLCHSNNNWAGTISLPVACQYAQKLAHLTATSLHTEPDEKHWKFLFYL